MEGADEKIFHYIDKAGFIQELLKNWEKVNLLYILSELFYKHYGQEAILLIDEYDVPLNKTFQHSYYKEMARL